MKLFVKSKIDPWITWDKDLWKESSIDDTAIIVPHASDADVIVVEFGDEIRLWNDKKYLVYVSSMDNDDLDGQTLLPWLPIIENVTFISDSFRVVEKLNAMKLKAERWYVPSRVPSKLMYDGNVSLSKVGFTITCNGSRSKDNLTEILRTYFAICLVDSEEEDGMLECMEDVDIFSAQELSFETFNNVTFHGLQPNPKMLKHIKGSKLFISPYSGTGVPLTAVDAAMLGTPILVRDTEVNRSVFNWNDRCFYKDEKELAQKIRFFSEIPLNDPEYLRIVEDGFNAVKETYSVTNSLGHLIYIAEKGLQHAK